MVLLHLFFIFTLYPICVCMCICTWHIHIHTHTIDNWEEIKESLTRDNIWLYPSINDNIKNGNKLFAYSAHITYEKNARPTTVFATNQLKKSRVDALSSLMLCHIPHPAASHARSPRDLITAWIYKPFKFPFICTYYLIYSLSNDCHWVTLDNVF